MDLIIAHRNVWMLEMCEIWARNSGDGRGEWIEPWEHDMEYIDFYLECEYDASYGDFEGEKIVDYDHEYIMSLLEPLFPQLKGAE